MTEYKKKYTKAEMDELKQWIVTTKPKGSIQVGPGIVVQDAEKFCKSIEDVLNKQYENVNYSGLLHTIFEFRRVWEEQHSQPSAPVPPSSSDQ